MSASDELMKLAERKTAHYDPVSRALCFGMMPFVAGMSEAIAALRARAHDGGDDEGR